MMIVLILGVYVWSCLFGPFLGFSGSLGIVMTMGFWERVVLQASG